MTAAEKNAQGKFYPEVASSPDFPALEREVLAYWNSQKIFEESVESRDKDSEYVFYDGPPFANGLPHYGHLLTGFVKDLFPRYQTMKGKRVERRFGWDCHGLPAEMGAEKELGVSGRANIEKFGIQKFNDYCRTSVMRYTSEWEDYVTRQARWVDFSNDYKTMDTNYMESVMWAFSELYKKGLVYESHRVMPYSWAMETPVSNFETRMDNSYREREDKAITAAFKLKEKPKGAPEAKEYYVLAWTTTPWTLPSNLGLAVSKGMTYMPLVENGKCYYLATSSVKEYLKTFSFSDVEFSSHVSENNIRHYSVKASPSEEQEKLVKSFYGCVVGGESLIGLSYEPLFPYFKDHPNSFKILDGSDFIEEGSGTGVVHMAPGFGEDDQRVCAANGIEILCPVDSSGRYTSEIFEHDGLALAGLNVVAETGKSADEPYTEKQLNQYGLANLRIITYLKGTGQLIKQEDYKHNYPHCWRTDTPLIYRALPSWYVEVSKFAPRMVELNEQINWIPDHIKHGRFGKWLEGARDWSISRNRYWGSPIPVWRTESGKIKVFGSIAELQDFFGVPVTDLHRPFIDELVKEEGGETWRRVTDVFDCWFESGSMPYAQVHYPFENKDWFENHFPADFIVEYEAQTRGWFYTMMVLSTALFDKPPFKNCICHGVVMSNEKDEHGRFNKLSKRLKNYPDPMEVYEQYGADALRWFMMSSPVMRGMEMFIDKEGKFIRDTVRLYIKPFWNAYNFFTLYANADTISAKLSFDSTNGMDRYILSKLVTAVRGVESALDAYDTPGACQSVTDFFENLNNWYIRRNKERFWKSEHDADKQSAYDTLYTVLHVMSRAAAPLLPLISENIYRGLTGEKSVHLADFPKLNFTEDAELMNTMDFVRDVCNAALAVRNKNNIRVRQPLQRIEVLTSDALHPAHHNFIHGYNGDTQFFTSIVTQEVNVKFIVESTLLKSAAEIKAQVNLPLIGKKLGPKIKDVTAATRSGDWKQEADGTLSIGGVVLQPGEFTILLEPKPEYKDSAQALGTNDALVVLDLTVTPELEAEGIARDMVRMIQQARKDANLNVSDRIALTLNAAENVAAAVKAHETYICEQTLTTAIHYGEPKDTAFRFDNELDDQKVTVAFSVAKAAA